jgi:hypothetical protein
MLGIISTKDTLLIVPSLDTLIYRCTFDIQPNRQNHVALKTWVVCEDRSFLIEQAGIVTSSTDEDTEEIPATVSTPAPDSGISPGTNFRQYNINLRRCLQNFMLGEVKVAIFLRLHCQLGMPLLERQPFDMRDSQSTLAINYERTQEFVKMGFFGLHRSGRYRQSQRLDWRVL